MRNNNRYGLTVFIGIVTSVITILSLALAVIMIFDNRRKQEDKELEEYLESTIS